MEQKVLTPAVWQKLQALLQRYARERQHGDGSLESAEEALRSLGDQLGQLLLEAESEAPAEDRSEGPVPAGSTQRPGEEDPGASKDPRP